MDFEEGFEQVDAAPMHEKMRQSLSRSGAVVLSDYGKGALDSVQQMIALAREANVPVLIDPKGTDFARYRGATLLTPNLSEFEAVVGKCKTENEIVERGMKLIADCDLSALLVTRSENGMSLLQPGKAPLHLPTQAQEVFDVPAPGIPSLACWPLLLAAGDSLEEACFLANAGRRRGSWEVGDINRQHRGAGKRHSCASRARFWHHD
ncbi:PfkB family carbohydrate kinase [Pantoea ananatis]